MSRPRDKTRCPLDKAVKPYDGFTQVPHTARAVGSCEGCGVGPIHGCQKGGGSACGCSFWRDGLRLCRECAWLYDMFFHGFSRITEPSHASVGWAMHRVKEIRIWEFLH